MSEHTDPNRIQHTPAEAEALLAEDAGRCARLDNLPASANPYRTAALRSAWARGHQRGRR